ncbi:MAG: DUF2339 domain-containing protein [Paracoccaceae bacterium]
MDELIFLIALVPTAVIAAVIYLVISHLRLKRKVAALENMLSAQPVAQRAEPETHPPEMAASNDEAAQVDATAAKGPWESPVAEPASAATPDGAHPRAFVLHLGNIDQARRWLAQNWFLAIAAISLALAGVFLVQYGVEKGLLTPFWRVIGAAVLGLALIWAGEFVRRRSGDAAEQGTAYLPSTFSGAGLVALFSAVLAARQLYGLIGPEAALFWLVLVSGVAVILGWFYGPYLAVVGILGSMAAPFLVGGDSDSPQIFFYYFALVTLTALAVDAIKRWAWVSTLALIFAYVAAWMFYSGGAGDEHFLAFALIVSAGAVTIPPLALWPRHDGAMIHSFLLVGRFKSPNLPEFPTRLAAGAFAAAGAAALLVALKDAGRTEVWLAAATLSALYVAAIVWFRRAPALADLAILPPLLFLAIIALQALDGGSLYALFQLGQDRPPETGPPSTVSVLAGIALLGSALAFWRTLWGGPLAQVWAAGAALLAPLTLVALEMLWLPEPVLGAGRWAAHAILIAAAMVYFAQSVARRDGDDKRRIAYFALSTLTMIAFALVIILSSAALTVALAVMVLAAALIDKRLDLALLSIFVQVGVVVIGWRLVIDPGVFWADNAPLWELALAYVGSAALLYAAWVMLEERARRAARLTVESGIWSILGVLASVLLNRALGSQFESHWGISLFASIWLMLMLVQLYRLRAGGILRPVRIALAAIYAAIAGLGYAALLVFHNPLDSSLHSVAGPPILDSLLVAFGIPALIFAVGVWKLPELHRILRIGFISLSALFAAAYTGLEIRRLWRGPNLSVPGTTDAELYTYTLALLLISVAILFYAFARRSVTLRRIATIGIGLTIAKVFLIDMAGLAGLLRVVSFLGLGLSLAALGWIDGQMSRGWVRDKPDN